MPRGRKPSTSEKKKEVPITEQFKPDDLVWIHLRGYPWWPARVFKEDEAPEEVLEEKRAKGTLLVHFLESNQFLWTKDAVPFRGDNYDKYAKERPRDKKFTLALKRCHEFEKGEYSPDVDTEEEEPEEPPAKKRKRSTSTKKESTSKSPAAGKRKRSDTASPPAKRAKGTDKGKKAAAPKAAEKSKGTTRKTQPNVQVAMSREVISIITDKLQQEIEQMRSDKILTLLEILARIAVDAPTLKEVPIMNCLQTLLSSSQSNRTIKQHATRIHQAYSAVVKAHQSELEPATEFAQASSSLVDGAASSEAAPTSTEADGDATMTDKPTSTADAPEDEARATPDTKAEEAPAATKEKEDGPSDEAPAPAQSTDNSSPQENSTPAEGATTEDAAPSSSAEESKPQEETPSSKVGDSDISMKEGGDEKAESGVAV